MNEKELVEVLPEKIGAIYKYMCYDMHGQNPVLPSLSSILSQVSRTLCWCRVKFNGLQSDDNQADEYPMLYFMNFAPSGDYKDMVQGSVRGLCKDVFRKKGLLRDRTYATRKSYVYDELKKKNAELGKHSKITESDIDGGVLRFKNHVTDESKQSFQNHRIAQMMYGIGEVHLNHDEFFDSFGTVNTNVDTLLSLYKTIYPKGYSPSNATLSDFRPNVYDVPATFFIHGDSIGMSNDTSMRQKFLTMLSSGNAKRSIITYSGTINRKQNRYRKDDDRRIKTSLKRSVCGIFDNLYLNTEPEKMSVKEDGYINWGYSKIEIPNNILKLIDIYEDECTAKGTFIKDKILRIKTLDNFWVATRVAVCVAAIEHPESLVVTEDDFEFAKAYVECVHGQLEPLLKEGTETMQEQVYKYILDNPKTSKSKITKMSKSRSKSQTDSLLELVKELASDNDMVLLEESGKGNSTIYSIVPRPEDKHEFDGVVHVSVSQSNDVKIATGFEYKEVSINDLPKIMNGNKMYSAAKYKDGKRSNDNYIGGDDLLLFDIDNGMTFDEALVKLDGYTYVICPTKSNGIEKHGVICDRFRIAMPITDLTKISSDQYKYLKNSVADSFGLKFDKQTTDVSRAYFGSNKNTNDCYIGEGDVLNASKYLDGYKKKSKVVSPIKYTNTDQEEMNNVIFETTKHGSITGRQAFNMLSPGETMACKCINPLHKDNNPSAFLRLNDDLTELQFKCMGDESCNMSKFYK